MAKIKYSATFQGPAGEFTITRGSLRDYGYTVAWAVLDADGALIGKGFSTSQAYAEQYANDWLRNASGRTALFAPVTK